MGCGHSTLRPNFMRKRSDRPATGDLPLETHDAADRTIVEGHMAGPAIAPRHQPTLHNILDGDSVLTDLVTDPQRVQVTADGPVTVYPFNTTLDLDGPSEDAGTLSRLLAQCPRFRILIIGKANAGKTTILQKFCNTTEDPIIRNQDGQELDPSIIQPTDGRGVHDISNELTFSTNDSFVFHDSRGFEASSVKELEDVREFIAKRAASTKLGDQLHAIWYCLPTDNDRPLSNAEMSFFQQGAGKAPVVAIFTKYDGMVLREYNKLRYEENYTREQARLLAPENANRIFLESDFYLKRLQGVPYPPATSLRVQDMHNPENSCAELSKQTVAALNSKRLQQLFVSVQQTNLGLSTEFALKEFILKDSKDAELTPASLDTVHNMVKNVLTCYGHLAHREDYGAPAPHDGNVGETEYKDLRGFIETIISRHSQMPSSLQVLQAGIAVLVIAEYSFWLEKHPLDSTFKPALATYQSSALHLDVMNEINEKVIGFGIQGPTSEPELIKAMLEIVGNVGVRLREQMSLLSDAEIGSSVHSEM